MGTLRTDTTKGHWKLKGSTVETADTTRITKFDKDTKTADAFLMARARDLWAQLDVIPVQIASACEGGDPNLWLLRGIYDRINAFMDKLDDEYMAFVKESKRKEN